MQARAALREQLKLDYEHLIPDPAPGSGAATFPNQYDSMVACIPESNAIESHGEYLTSTWYASTRRRPVWRAGKAKQSVSNSDALRLPRLRYSCAYGEYSSAADRL